MKKVGLIVLILVAIAGITGLFFWFQPTAKIADGNADFTLSIEDLVNEGIETNDSLFNSKYVDKIIQFSGDVSSIKIDDSQSEIKLDVNTDETVIVRAAFDPSQNNDLQNIKEKDSVTCQCKFNGISLPDDPDDLLSEIIVSFSRCSIKK
jgi:hypothetical protein